MQATTLTRVGIVAVLALGIAWVVLHGPLVGTAALYLGLLVAVRLLRADQP